MLSMPFLSTISSRVLVSLAILSVQPCAFAIDKEDAQSLARQNGCFKCHGIDKKKDGPAYKDVALQYKKDAEAPAKLYRHVTVSSTVLFFDGHEEEIRL